MAQCEGHPARPRPSFASIQGAVRCEDFEDVGFVTLADSLGSHGHAFCGCLRRPPAQQLPTWLDPSDFMPHGYCYLWDPVILGLHVISDGLIALSYFCIPLALIYLVRKRTDLPFNWIFAMFGFFILGCGATHVMEIWTVWHASYLLAGIVKAFTAVVSVTTAVMLVPLIPKAIALPSVQQLRLANQELQIADVGAHPAGSAPARNFGGTRPQLRPRWATTDRRRKSCCSRRTALARKPGTGQRHHSIRDRLHHHGR